MQRGERTAIQEDQSVFRPVSRCARLYGRGGAPWEPLFRSGAPWWGFIDGIGLTERRGRENAISHAGPLQRRLYPRHVRLYDHLHAAGGERGGEFPLRRSRVISALHSRTQRARAGSKQQSRQLPTNMGHGLGQTNISKFEHSKKYRK